MRYETTHTQPCEIGRFVLAANDAEKMAVRLFIRSSHATGVKFARHTLV